MVQGTTSDAGKSTLVTALCRWVTRQGVSVVPFKPQNMALNSAVTADGGEIGRAQAVQAQAAYLEPHTDMNPVLLKPNSDTGAQVIIHGRAVTTMNAVAYHDYKAIAMQAVLASHARLSAAYPVVMVEGAGSPAEINLRAGDIANMGFAEAVDCPVLLIADINRGGVFAHLVGTLELLSPSEQARVKGFIINRFRGDIALLQPGLDWLEQRTGKPVIGVLPYVLDLHLEAEDGIDQRQTDKADQVLKVVVPVLPRISNHTDFDPLRLHPQVDLQFVGPGQAIPPADLIILPGSKSVRNDLAYLRANGWETAISRHLRYGGKVLGICGGLQMLGEQVHDPLGLEGVPGPAPGWGCWRLKPDSKNTSSCAMCAGVWRWRTLKSAAMKSMPASPPGRRWKTPPYCSMTDAATVRKVSMGRFSAPICTVCSNPRQRAAPCCVGRVCRLCRTWITTDCASGISSGWRIWWRRIWIPGCCVSSVGFEVTVQASSRACPR